MATIEPVVTILPGVPGMAGLTVDDGRIPYPDTTTDFVKVLGGLGVQAAFIEPKAERRYVGHKAWEIWLPILQVTIEVLVATEAGLLVEIIKSYLVTDEPPQDGTESADQLNEAQDLDRAAPLLHVDWRVTMQDGREERFVANGHAEEVQDALETFEQHVRDL